MADLTITAANSGLSTDRAVQIEIVQVGEAVTHIQPVYMNASDSKYYRDDADTANVLKGVTLTSGATNDYVIIIKGGPFEPGATLTVGETYVVSPNVGLICPIGDLASGDYAKILGVAKSAAILDLNIYSSTVAKA